METLKGIILPDGRFKEVNPFEYPSTFIKGINYYNRRKIWKDKEDSLRTFEIDMQRMIADHNTFVGFEDGQFKIGDIVEAQLLPNGKVRII